MPLTACRLNYPDDVTSAYMPGERDTAAAMRARRWLIVVGVLLILLCCACPVAVWAVWLKPAL